ncbi:hypothetical protein [Thioclava sp. NG1]|uniref:hypothetical protein n=1 Tax=Thioclava sp. NG1 TaxID=2182426 RepID=UPI0011B26B41|nr:hypothetical protein [Thioclava sp. NG1]
MSELKPPMRIPGLSPFVCTYYRDGRPFGITLYGDTEESVIENNCDVLDGLRVDGVLEGTIELGGE